MADRDSYGEREEALQEAVNDSAILYPKHRIVWALAFRSVEAWVLADPKAIADEIGSDVAKVNKCYPAGVSVEDLSERSGKKDHRPKKLLERIFQLMHKKDSTELRQAIAQRTDIDVLEKDCAKGFAPFAQRLRDKLRDEVFT